MDRISNAKALDEWIVNNGPLGKEKLAVKSGVSSSLIERARKGIAPRRQSTMRSIATAMDKSLDELFPIAVGEDSAS